MRQAMTGNFEPNTIEILCRKNIILRKWQQHLVYAWPSWEMHWQNWVNVEGEEHLESAMTGGRGVVLLSAHAYGFSGRVVSVMRRKGYRIPRIGRGSRVNWTNGSTSETARPWQERIKYGEDSWQHLRALRSMRQVLADGGIVHLLIRGFPSGEPKLEIPFYHGRFFLDPLLFRVIEMLEAPVLPCFALCDDRGRLRVTFYPALPPQSASIMDVFGPLYASYLRDRPEFAWFWRRLVRRDEFW